MAGFLDSWLNYKAVAILLHPDGLMAGLQITFTLKYLLINLSIACFHISPLYDSFPFEINLGAHCDDMKQPELILGCLFNYRQMTLLITYAIFSFTAFLK